MEEYEKLDTPPPHIVGEGNIPGCNHHIEPVVIQDDVKLALVVGQPGGLDHLDQANQLNQATGLHHEDMDPQQHPRGGWRQS